LLAQQEQAEARHREAEARQRVTDARLEELMRRVGGESKASEPPSAGTPTTVAAGTPTAGELSTPASAPSPATDPTPAAVPTPVGATLDGNFGKGKLDSSILDLFWAYGEDDLSSADEWIAQAEEIAEMHNLGHKQLCVAFQKRATGKVKALLNHYAPAERHDWPALCRILLSNFGRETRRRWCRQELSSMDGFAGLNLGAALSRLQGLLTAAEHLPTDKDPIMRLLKAFPEFRPVVMTMNFGKMTWMEALKALRDKEVEFMVSYMPQQLPIAKPETKNPSRGATVGPVATIESAAPVEPVAATQPAESPGPVAVVARPAPGRRSGIKCYRCRRLGHAWYECKAKVIIEDSQSKN